MSKEGSSILFDRCPKGLDRRRLRTFHRMLEHKVADGRSFNFLLTHDSRLHKWNLTYRNVDAATDVLSFPSEELQGFLGEVAVSIERAGEQAGEHGHSLEAEIEILMLHGALHLTGMDHESDRGQMARAELSWRQRLGLPVGLIERAGKTK